jgi:hypothetical protein
MLFCLDDVAMAWPNGFTGQSNAVDLFTIAVAKVGAPLMIIGVVTLWWPGPGRHSEWHVLVSCGLSFLLGVA